MASATTPSTYDVFLSHGSPDKPWDHVARQGRVPGREVLHVARGADRRAPRSLVHARRSIYRRRPWSTGPRPSTKRAAAQLVMQRRGGTVSWCH